MEIVILIGIQATGKSTFYKTHFADTHMRINLDMLKTRHREAQFFQLCLETQQHCVVDNTNVTREERAHFITLARNCGAKVRGFYFASSLPAALQRNAARHGQTIPEKGVVAPFGRLQLPAFAEGFDELF